MVFSSTTFLFIFFPAVLLCYFNPVLKSREWKNRILLFFSIAFYAWGEPLFVFLVLAMALWNWYAGLRIQGASAGGKRWGQAAIAGDVLLLVIFKYLTFLTKQLALLTGNESLIVEIALPIGISFFVFQMMSYIFDVLKGTAEAQKNPFDVLLYIMMFPQLIAGPIVRYDTVAAELHGRRESRADFAEGIRRFVYGLGKKVLLADYLAIAADTAFGDIGGLSLGTAWLGAICYTLQIYFDFSGYSDMAIGMGRIFGFHFMENFNYPYAARSVTDFWRRWHISLSTWFRDYVYIPLGGNRVSAGKCVRNLFVVWLLTGIWHGANWTFAVWGMFYFVFLLLERAAGVERVEHRPILSRLYTLLVVMAAWVIFRADTLGEGVSYLAAMIGLGSGGVADGTFLYLLGNCSLLLPLAVIFSLPVYPLWKRSGESGWKKTAETVFLLAVFGLSLLNCVGGSYSPFLYFNF